MIGTRPGRRLRVSLAVFVTAAWISAMDKNRAPFRAALIRANKKKSAGATSNYRGDGVALAPVGWSE